jgi:hypothetical protein
MASWSDELLSDEPATEQEPTAEHKTSALHEPAAQNDFLLLQDGCRNEGYAVSPSR